APRCPRSSRSIAPTRRARCCSAITRYCPRRARTSAGSAGCEARWSTLRLRRPRRVRLDDDAVREVGEEILDRVELLGTRGEGRGAHEREAFAHPRLERDRGPLADEGRARRLAGRGREQRVAVEPARALDVARSAGEVTLPEAREVKALALLVAILRG